ncbi:MAG: hypothetical protein HeimC3_06480 [Candidatus Heimdallarchaeota archaeon LC_3]|nr:MAG: hypothetical protein HeimC3_06480 [Candidatus Heimdallarchaeota archaeon LC_3]
MGMELSSVIDMNVEGKISRNEETNSLERLTENDIKFSSNSIKTEYNKFISSKSNDLNVNIENTNNNDSNKATKPNQRYPNYKLLDTGDESLWYNKQWRYRKNITIPASNVNEDLTDFPLLVDIYDIDLKHALNSGFDILFTDEYNNKLAHEIELFDKYYNSTHAHLITWIKTDLSSTINNTLMMYFGFPFSNSQEDAINVWTNGYEAVYHMSESPAGNIIDSKGVYNGSAFGGMDDSNLQSGVMGNGYYFSGDFNGSDDIIEVGNFNSNSWGEITIEAWINHFDETRWENVIIAKAHNNWDTTPIWTLDTDGKEKINFFASTDGTGGSTDVEITGTTLMDVSGNQWYQTVVTWDGSTIRAYLDANQEKSVSLSGDSFWDSNNVVTIGGLKVNTWTIFHGKMDEIRVSSTARSPGWLSTQYNNQIDPNSFYSIQTLEEFVLEQNWAFESLPYRKNITILSSQVPENLSYFPFLLNLLDPGLHDEAQPDGEDILFTDNQGVRIEHEIEEFINNYNSSHSKLLSWIKIPHLSSISDTTIIMYYGNSSISNYDLDFGVWDLYKGVWHLSESVNDESLINEVHKDSSFNSNYADQLGNNEINGVIGNAQELDGVNDYIRVVEPEELNLNEAMDYSISLWFYRDTTSSSETILSKRNGNSLSDLGYSVYINNSDGLLYFEVSEGVTFETGIYSTSNFTLLPSGWFYINLQFSLKDSAIWKIFINGTDDSGTMYGSNPKDLVSGGNSFDFNIGAESDSQNFFDGRFDEVRISTKNSSSNWILTEYNNQLSPESFFIISNEVVRDFIVPTIENFGVEDLGKGQATFWANITDNRAGVDTAFIEINNSDFELNFNGSLWIYQQSVNFNGFYEFRIINSSDFAFNINSTPTNYLNHTFSLDNVAPNVIDWEYYSEIGLYGTFNANVSDSWGTIDKVLIIVTNRGNKTAVMQNTANGYINNTLVLAEGLIDFVIQVNDTAGNFEESEIHTDYVTGTNVPPSAENVTITPLFPNSSQNLILSYDFVDIDGDSPNPPKIIWYKNGILQLGFNNSFIINSQDTKKGEIWNATLQPFDGALYGDIAYSNNVIIANGAPSILDLSVTENPTTTINLEASWTYSDVDGDSSKGYEIIWYRNNIPSIYYNDTTILASVTMKGEIWNYSLQVFDGENYSVIKFSEETIILNSLPSASNLNIVNSSFIQTTNQLIANWTYFDPDNDIQIGFTLLWYKNGELQQLLNDSQIINPGNTSRGQSWYFSLRVTDGINNSVLYTLVIPTVILNAIPTVSGFIFNNQSSNNTLLANWIYSDSDSDTEIRNNAIIYWYKDGLLQVNFNNTDSIPSSFTTKGEIWNFTLRVHDGTNYSITYYSNSITILNSAPTISDLSITVNPTNDQDLVASWTFNDVDALDFESDLIINWYNNSVLQNQLGNSTVVLNGNTTRYQVWNFTLKVFDGYEWSTLYISEQVNISNAIPEISGVPGFVDSTPTVLEDIIIQYTYFDYENDSEVNASRIIFWYKLNEYQPQYDNNITIPSSETFDLETWYYIIMVYDGFNFSINYTSQIAGIGSVSNTPPIVGNLTLLEATSSNDLIASYDFYDADGDPDITSDIKWYKDGIHQPMLDGLLIVQYTQIIPGEKWNFTIIPYDGRISGTLNSSNTIIVSNSAPIALGLTITETPETANNLIISWNYQDIDGDNQSSFLILWYKNGELQTDLNNSLTVSSSLTKKGEIWNYTLKVYDGSNYSSLVSSPMTIIQNTIPVISGLEILNGTSIYTNNNLFANWTFFDINSDTERDYLIQWYKNDNPILSLDNETVIFNGNTSKGESWYFKIQVFDGVEWSNFYSSQPITILNSKPFFDGEIIINSTEFVHGNPLTVYYNYSDINGDSEIGTIINWYKDGIYQQSFDNLITIDGTHIRKGQEWYVNVTLSDGIEFSNFSLSVNFSIGNTNPVVDSISIYKPSNRTTRDNIILSYSTFDVDGDDITNFSIRWFLDSTEQAQFENDTFIGFVNTAKNQNWTALVRIYDGENWSDFNSTYIITINTSPIIGNLTLLGGEHANDDVILQYDYFDYDNDPEQASILRWLIFNGTPPFKEFFTGNTLPSSNFKAGDWVWIELTPYDGFEYGIEIESIQGGPFVLKGIVVIGDFAPVLTVIPDIFNMNHSSSFTVISKIAVNYTAYDSDILDLPDVDNIYLLSLFSQDGVFYVRDAEYRWFKNNLLTQHTGPSVDPQYLFKGDQWHVIVRVPDLYGLFSLWYNSSTITIENSAPIIENIDWLNLEPTGQENIDLVYDYSDINSDLEQQSKIQWYINGIEINDHENETSLSSIYINRGDIVYLLITPFDGELFGSTYNSSDYTGLLYVKNSSPEVLSVEINNQLSTFTDDSLNLSWIYFDFDGDTEDTNETIIEWYINGELQTGLTNLTTIDSSFTLKNQRWQVVISAYDGENYSISIYCLYFPKMAFFTLGMLNIDGLRIIY